MADKGFINPSKTPTGGPQTPFRKVIDPPEVYPFPTVGDLTAGDGASRGEKPTGGSINVPQPSNIGPRTNGGETMPGQGK